MEIIRDGDLAAEIRRKKLRQKKVLEKRGLELPVFTDEEVFSILYQLVSAVSFMHLRGMAH